MATPNPIPTLQKIENAAFTFLQAHYAKVFAAILGFITSHFGLIGKIF